MHWTTVFAVSAMPWTDRQAGRQAGRHTLTHVCSHARTHAHTILNSWLLTKPFHKQRPKKTTATTTPPKKKEKKKKKTTFAWRLAPKVVNKKLKELLQRLQQQYKWGIRLWPAQIYHKAYSNRINGKSDLGLQRFTTKLTEAVWMGNQVSACTELSQSLQQ